MNNKLRVKVFADGDHVGDHEFDDDVIKIGSLRSSKLVLDGDGVARMHAVIERNNEGVYRLIDLGSASGSYLDEVRIDKNSTLPQSGTLKFGSFQVQFELDDSPVRAEPSDRSSFEGDDHHQALCQSLTDELERLQSGATQEAKKMLARWSFIGGERRRKWLRLLVEEIRSCRQANQVFQRKRLATMLNLGMDGMEAIYRLDPEEALQKAHETLMDMAVSKTALEMLNSMELATNMKKAFKALPPEEQEKQRGDLDGFIGAHEKLADRLQTSIVAAGSLIPAYLSRAGGREATDADRFQWKAAFDQIKAMQDRAANEAN